MASVYFANHVRWRGPCREMFLKGYAAGVLDAMRSGLKLVTTRVSCGCPA